MFAGIVRGLRFALLGTAVAAAPFCQAVSENSGKVLSNREARKAAFYIEEATLPSELSTSEFTVRISVGKDGRVKKVSNPYSLPKRIFAVTSDAARQWRFPSDRAQGMPRVFEAEITFHGPMTGRVTTQDGAPVAEVELSGSPWKCCPTEQDIVKTDQSGSFRIEHPGNVLHVHPGSRFQPQALVVTSAISPLNMTLDSASSTLTLADCREPQRGFDRIGWGKYGLQYDVPQDDVQLMRGQVDADYVLHYVKAKSGDDHIEFWFGSNAMTPTPADEQLIESESFSVRNVVRSQDTVRGSNDGVIGSDFWGHLANGQMWRQVAFGFEGARYRDVSPENAALFDKIINSVCWIPYPEH